MEIAMESYVGHGGQQFGQVEPWRCQQSSRQNRSMFSLGTTAVGPGLLLQRKHKPIIDAAHQ